MKSLMLALALSFTSVASADWSLDPHASVGYNPAQGTHFTLGLDLSTEVDENLRAGVGAYYAAGERPEHDREFGVGPFVTYVQPLTRFLLVQLRQEVNYVNLHYPIKTISATGTTYSHEEEQGVASETTASLHLFFTRNFVISGGYRFVLGLTNDKLDDDRSGAFVGLALGF